MIMELSATCKSAFLSGDRQRGDVCFDLGSVTVLSVGTEGALGIASGASGQTYRLGVDFRELSDEVVGASCDCPRFEQGENCKHLWAFLRELDSRVAGFIKFNHECYLDECDPDDLSIGELIESGERPPGATIDSSDNASSKTLSLRPNAIAPWRKSLAAVAAARNRNTRASPPIPPALNKQTRRWIVIRLGELTSDSRFSLLVFSSKRKIDGDWGIPRITIYDPNELGQIADSDERKAIGLLKAESVYRGYRYGDFKKTLIFRDELLPETLAALCATGRFVWTLDTTPSLTDFNAVQFSGSTPWHFSLQITELEQGRVQVNAILHRTTVQAEDVGERPDVLFQDRPREERNVEQVIGICESGAVLFAEEIGVLAPDAVQWTNAWRKNGRIDITKSELSDFMQELLSITSPPVIELPDSLGFETVQLPPQGLLKLRTPERSNMYLTAELSWRYDQVDIPASNDAPVIWDATNERMIKRNQAQETQMLGQLGELTLHEHHQRYGQQSELRMHRKHLVDTVNRLTELDWEVVADGARLVQSGNIDIKVESGEDWFDVHADVKFGEQTASLPTLLAALRKGEKFVKLDDGSQGILPGDWLAKYDGLLRAGEAEGDKVRFQPNQALMLDMFLAEEEVSFDRKFSTWCKKIKSFSGVKQGKQPRSFRGELRDYQKDALGWFKFLKEFRFGGCLADDMGLGKTVQVLAMLEGRRVRRLPEGEVRRPSLAVVPKSLVFNWIDEAARFAPKMKVVDYTGLGRNSCWEEIETCDLVVTTYATMRRDIEKLRKRKFDYAILDEAQAIKNPTAQATKAARLLKSDFRLAMTGTPVENHLGDLWSLFDFLNPGMLGNTTASNFTGVENRSQRLSALSNALKPFIMRRTKQQVLTELPEKTEQTLFCEMLPAQKKQYNELRDHYRAVLTKKIKADGMNRSKIQVLEALLRLRQAACDPRLIAPRQKAKGAKIELLLQQVEELQSEGHKVLVFSQFTSLLALVRQELDKMKTSYEYLDGKTAKRAECVKRFQEDGDCRVFLISLKAGGHGLNLTAANYVFILDPWWNPAVEAQAIDRAHRMGQANPVTAYRLIAKDTVEDKIIKLQESKRELANAIISADASLISGLSINDLRVLFE